MPLSTFLNGRAPTTLRGAQWLSFTDTAVIQTRSAVSDGGGGASVTWQNAGTAACRIYPVTTRGRSGLVGGQIDEHSTHYCDFPLDTSVNTSDRVVIAGRGTFEVTMALERTSPFTTVVEVVQIS